MNKYTLNTKVKKHDDEMYFSFTVMLCKWTNL